MPSPDYSPFAGTYAESRPMYPAELFDYLASLTETRALAWDCATGNGQAAAALARHFDRVVATDISAEQIRHAIPHPRIEYRVAASEESGLEDHSVDVLTVATALHWFHLDRFYSEAGRVIRPGGVLAAWTYHVAYIEPPFNEIFARFYRDVLYDYFDAGARLVDDRYRSITLPGRAIQPKQFAVSAAWNLNQMLTFVRSWSGLHKYIKDVGEDPVPALAAELKRIWGDGERILVARWPLYARISRL